jgi:hypothetical protein
MTPYQHSGHLGAVAAEPQDQPDRAGDCECWILNIDTELVEQRTELIEHVGDGGLEQLGLAGEVVVERAEADIGGLGDLLDAGLSDRAAGQHRSRGGDELLAGVGLTPLDPAPGTSAAGPGRGRGSCL